jgi:SAM-dependent methyltransferase
MEDLIKQGEAFFNEGRTQEAEKCFLSVLDQDPGNKTVLNILGLLAYNDCRNQEAIDYFSGALASDPFYKDAVLNYAHLLKGLDLLPEAFDLIEKNVDRYPGDDELKQLLEEAVGLQPGKLKMAVLCLPGLQSFLGDIVEFLSTKYEIQTCYSGNGQEIEDAVGWADIVWIEWVNQLAISLTNNPTLLKDKHVICRLHRYEAFTDMPGKVNWNAIDDLIFVASHIKESMKRLVPDIEQRVRTHVVYNGIDLERFGFLDRRPGFDIAYVGYLNHRKNPTLLLQCLSQLVNIDPRYTLHIAGEFQASDYRLYFEKMVAAMGLEYHIRMGGWVDDVAGWLGDKQYFIHTSVHEGHPVGIMEAMACGIKPLIHNFAGAGEIYPRKYLWNTIDEFIQKITEDEYASSEYRRFIKDHYSLGLQIGRIENIVSHAKAAATPPPVEIKPEGRADAGLHYPKGGSASSEDARRWYNGFLGVLKNDHLRENPRHKHIKQTLEKIIKPGMKVLDIGCGTGISSRFMAELGARVIGVDLSDELISYANKESAHQNVSYMVQDASQLYLKARFEAITAIDSMEHIPRDRVDAFVASVCRHARGDTIIYINIPDGRYQQFLRANHPQRLQIIDEDYDPGQLIAMFQKHGFQPFQVSIYGIDLPVQYNEYFFMTAPALENVYEQSYKKLGI